MMRLHRSMSSSLRVFSPGRPIELDEIRAFAPSVFATEAHDSRSERYGYVDSQKVLLPLLQEGFQVFEVRHQTARDVSKAGHATHMLRMRHRNGTALADGVVPEVLYLNSHAGQTQADIFAGAYRYICTNGLMTGDTFKSVKVMHRHGAEDKIIEGVFKVLDSQPLLGHTINEMSSVSLDRGEQQVFARAAMDLRWDRDEETGNSAAPVTPDQLLIPARYEDRQNDVWTVFNRLQERLIRGGVRGVTANGRRTTTREVEGIQENTRINRALFTLAQGMAELKRAA